MGGIKLGLLFKNFDYFLATVEQGSITKAAEKLFISQPSLSRFLSRLESSLGISLFDRSAAPVKLTYAGERYYQYILKTMEMEKQLFKEFDEIRSNERGKITIGIAPWRGSCLLPEILPSFIQTYPHIEIQLKEGPADYLENLIIKDKVDFCIMNLPVNYPHTTYELIMNERILVIANQDHPFVQEIKGTSNYQTDSINHIELDQLKNESFIMLKPEQNLAKMVYHTFYNYMIKPHVIFETTNITTALNLVSAGIGFTFMCEAGAKYETKNRNIMAFSFGNPELNWVLAAVYKKHSYMTKISRLFLDYIKAFYQADSPL